MRHDHGEFIPEMWEFFNIHKSIDMIYHINKSENKNHMIIPINAEKISDKIQYSFRFLKTFHKVDIEDIWKSEVKVLVA